MKHAFLFVCAVACMLTVACAKKESPPPPPPAAAPKPSAAVQKPVSSATVAAVANPYDLSGKKDPFKPFVVAKAPPVQTAAPAARPRSLLPIQNYEVSQFRVIGIIAGLSENKAMVVDPAGKCYVLKQGMQIGLNNGKVSKITDSYIEVFERFREDSGNSKQRSVKLTLPRKQ